MNAQTPDQSISAAVERLKELYPGEESKVIVYNNDPVWRFAVSIGDCLDSDGVFQCGKTLDESMGAAIKRAGPRTTEAKKQARIAELKKELSELEAAQ